jgi:hypothetical protein
VPSSRRASTSCFVVEIKNLIYVPLLFHEIIPEITGAMQPVIAIIRYVGRATEGTVIVF